MTPSTGNVFPRAQTRDGVRAVIERSPQTARATLPHRSPRAMHLRTDRCLLRPFTHADAPSLAHHAGNRNVWLNLRDIFPHPYSRADAESFIARVADEAPRTTFAIDVGGEAVGSIGLILGTDIARRSAEIGYWLGEAFWGRGITSAAVSAVTTYAFRELELLRVFAVPFAHNAASARVLERADYQLEGTLRRSTVKSGEVLDQLLYAAVMP